MKKQGGATFVAIIILIPAFCCAGFFYVQTVWAATAEIVINEVAWMGDKESATHEWLELFNAGESEVDLSGWLLAAADSQPKIFLQGKILPHQYFLLERGSDASAPSSSADQIYKGALNNSGEVLILKNAVGEIVDRINASSSWPAGDNNNKLTMARTFVGVWQNSLLPGGTPGKENVFASNYQLREDENIGQTTKQSSSTADYEKNDNMKDDNKNEIRDKRNRKTNSASSNFKLNKVIFGDVLINEICSDPGDGEVEWVELFYKKTANLDLSGWFLQEGSGARTDLSGKKFLKDTSRFVVVEDPKGNLNNNGDMISLYDSSNSLIDRVVYGKWDDGYIEDNAPIAKDPLTIVRKSDGYNVGGDKENFVLTKLPTKGSANIVQSPFTQAQEDNKEFSYSDDIIISEIYPNPPGDDRQGEFIELYNKGDYEINLFGWALTDKSGHRYEFVKQTSGQENIIQAKNFFVITREQSNISLNNSGEELFLYRPLEDKYFIKISYDKAKTGESYAWDGNKWRWTRQVTAGKDNIILTENHPPIVDFSCPEKIFVGCPVIFDGSDSEDEDNDELSFLWDFGDGFTSKLVLPEHTYFTSGKFTVILTVDDNKDQTTKEKTVYVKERFVGDLLNNRENKQSGKEETVGDFGKIVINELLPNPRGEDILGEWIELYNRGETSVDLSAWTLDDKKGGSVPYRLKGFLPLAAGAYLLINREQSGLALNNTSDMVRLFDANGNLLDQTVYERPQENVSWARNDNGKFVWTSKPTPGTKNIINKPIDYIVGKDKIDKKKILFNEQFYDVDLSELKNYEKGDKIATVGTVIVLPGVFSAQYFYIQNKQGAQIYNYHGDFPDLKYGDLIRVKGELSFINNEARIKTTKNNIDIIGVGSTTPQKITCADLTAEVAGQLLLVNGEVTGRKGHSVFVDDGSGEILVFLKEKTGIEGKDIKTGDYIKVLGIANRTRFGIRLLPRSVDDIEIKKETSSFGTIKGADETIMEWELPSRVPQKQIIPYFLVLIVAVMLTFAGLAVKYGWFY